MWTPRRILLLAVGAGLALAAFLVYDRFLGWMNGLPALPERYLVAARPDSAPVAMRNDDRKRRFLRLAFGDHCPEIGYIYQLEVQTQGLILATDNHDIVDGRIRFWPLSLVVIGKVNPKTGFPEIQTVHCDSATITFDRRIETLSDIWVSKMVAAEFESDRALAGNDPRAGFIHVTHNHGTPQIDDDLTVQAVGPVLFEDTAATQPNRPQLWTDRPVQITDRQTQPPHRIAAQNFGLYLEPNALKAGEKPRPGEKSSGVRMVELGNVHMLLTIDQPSDFLASPAQGKRALPERPVLSIRTLGSFQYHVAANRADFTIPRNANGLRHAVEVVRSQPTGNDELRCEKLVVQFRRPTPRDNNGAMGAPLAIDEVRATGSRVAISSTAERLNAQGTELVFRHEKREAVLRGAPMSATREGNRIEAPELYLHRPDPSIPIDPSFPVVLARATGPGTVWLHDTQRQHRGEARWRGELVIDREQGHDRITVDGAAVFEDRTNSQWLSGDQIRIWTEPDPKSTRSETAVRPRRMQVTGHVAGRTPELQIDNTPVLVVEFEDAPRLLRPTLPAPPTPSPVVQASASRRASPPPRLGPPVIEPAAIVSAPPAPRKKLVKISAAEVGVKLRRAGGEVELDRVECRSQVFVRQDPDQPGERGLEVHATKLELVHVPEGDVLTLSGDRLAPARVDVPEMSLHGPAIVFNQRDNRVDVIGAGRVTLITGTNLNGEKLSRPAEVHISWQGRMDFSGNRVSFIDGVLAEQENARVRDEEPEREVNRLACPKMDVYLDRAISFSAWHKAQTTASGQATDERPKVKRVVCHPGEIAEAGLVVVTSHAWRGGKLVRMQLVEAPEATLENETGEVTAAGRGEMRLFQLGERAGVETPSPSSTEQEFTLTRVQFRERMRASNRTQTVTFHRDVRVTHVPTDDPNLIVNPDKLPARSFRLTCRTLEVTSHTDQGRRFATMVARGKADIFANEFSGRADVIKYDESKKQQVIFDAEDGSNPSVLYHIQKKGEPPRELMGKTILYYRQTNECRVSGGVGIFGSQ